MSLEATGAPYETRRFAANRARRDETGNQGARANPTKPDSVTNRRYELNSLRGRRLIRVHFDRDCAEARGDHFDRLCPCGHRWAERCRE